MKNAATDNRAIYRTLYKGLAKEAIQAGIAVDLKGFTELAREVVPAGTFNTTIDALVSGLDILEAYVDDRIESYCEEPPEHEPNEEMLYRQQLWHRSCDAQHRYRA